MSTFGPIVAAAKARAVGRLDAFTHAYVTDGGTYVVASSPNSTDSGLSYDLVAVLPLPIEGTRVKVLRPTVNPELVTALRAVLDGEVA